jgi:hypothetical protein
MLVHTLRVYSSTTVLVFKDTHAKATPLRNEKCVIYWYKVKNPMCVKSLSL